MRIITKLEAPSCAEIDDLLVVWESSVRATHDFLSESDIVALRPDVLEGLKAVSLWAAVEGDGRIVGFAGIYGDMLEMLFVRAEARGQGLGRALIIRAMAEGVTRVDVNEQNPEALGFYEHMGFEVVGRSARDGQGREFPLLHMRI